MVVGRMQPDDFDSLLVSNLESNNCTATNCPIRQLTLGVEAIYILWGAWMFRKLVSQDSGIAGRPGLLMEFRKSTWNVQRSGRPRRPDRDEEI